MYILEFKIVVLIFRGARACPAKRTCSSTTRKHPRMSFCTRPKSSKLNCGPPHLTPHAPSPSSPHRFLACDQLAASLLPIKLLASASKETAVIDPHVILQGLLLGKIAFPHSLLTSGLVALLSRCLASVAVTFTLALLVLVLSYLFGSCILWKKGLKTRMPKSLNKSDESLGC